MAGAETAADSRTCHYTRHEWRLVESRDPSGEFERVLVYRCRACDARTERHVPDSSPLSVEWRGVTVTGRTLACATVVLVVALVVLLVAAA